MPFAAGIMHNSEVLNILENNGAFIDISQDDAKRLLLWADVRRIKLIAQMKVIDNFSSVRNKEGKNALHIYSEMGWLEEVKEIISYISVDAKDNENITPLMFAVYSNHIEMVRLLLERGANMHLVSDRKHNALHIACKNGNKEIAEMLLDAGMDIDARGDTSWTPIMFAAYNDHTEIVRLLLERGANTSFVSDNKNNVLHLVCLGNNKEIARMLLDAGMDIDARGGEDDDTPLMLAAYYDYIEVVKFLLSKNCGIVKNDEYDEEIKKLIIAAENTDKLMSSQDIAFVNDINFSSQHDLSIDRAKKIIEQRRIYPEKLYDYIANSQLSADKKKMLKEFLDNTCTDIIFHDVETIAKHIEDDLADIYKHIYRKRIFSYSETINKYNNEKESEESYIFYESNDGFYIPLNIVRCILGRNEKKKEEICYMLLEEPVYGQRVLDKLESGCFKLEQDKQNAEEFISKCTSEEVKNAYTRQKIYYLSSQNIDNMAVINQQNEVISQLAKQLLELQEEVESLKHRENIDYDNSKQTVKRQQENDSNMLFIDNVNKRQKMNHMDR